MNVTAEIILLIKNTGTDTHRLDSLIMRSESKEIKQRKSKRIKTLRYAVTRLQTEKLN